MIRALFTALTSTVIIGVFAIPVVLFSLFSRSDWMVTMSSRVWARAILRVAGARLVVLGREFVADGAPRFFVGNHQGTLDIPILISALGGCVRFMAKRALFRIPVFGLMLTRGRYAPVDRRDARRTLETLQKMLQSLRERPISFAVFPEGRRTDGSALFPFRPGSLKVCQRSGFDIVPFAIEGSFRLYDHRAFRVTPCEVRLIFSKPIPAAAARAMSVSELCRVVREAVAHSLRASVEPVDDSVERDAAHPSACNERRPSKLPRALDPGESAKGVDPETRAGIAPADARLASALTEAAA